MKKFLILDGNNLMFRAYYALPQLTSFDGEYSNAVFGFTNMMIKMIKELNPEYIAVTFDVSKKTFRHDVFPEYKGTRKPMPDELRGQFPIIKDLLKKMNITVVEKEGYEADDLMGSLSRKFTETDNIIVSADRDSFQLINKNTSILFPKKGVTETIQLNESNLKEFYGVDPTQVIDLKSLMGDSSDNIPGVGGVGEKTALDLINKYGSLDGVYANINETKGKLHEKLLNDKDKAYMSQYLATIETKVDLDYTIEDFKYDFPFKKSVLAVFKKFQFNVLMKKTDLFDLESSSDGDNVIVIKSYDEISKILDDCKKGFAFYIDEKNIYVYANNDYKIEFAGDLLSNSLDIVEVLNKFKPILEDDKIKKTVFDGKYLMHTLRQFGISLKCIDFDCMIARYLINSNAKANIDIDSMKIECGVDEVAFGKALYLIKENYYSKLKQMGLLSLFYDIEMPLSLVLFDMEISGFKVDKDELNNLEVKYREELLEIENAIYDCAGTKFNISSPKQLSEILFDKLNLNIPSNKKRSTSIEVLNEISYSHEIVPLIIRYRTVTKLYSSYIIGFLNLLDQNNKIHTVFNQTLTSTGRLSSSEPNLQNIPVRTEEGRGLRKVFIPSHKDGFIVSADYSQIELRLLANFSGDDKLINAFNSGEDIHSRTASEIFGIPIEEITPEIRRNAKAINFGIVYGISSFGLSQNIKISRKEADEYIKMYFDRYPKINNYLKENVNYCKNNGFVKTVFGRIRYIPEINGSNYALRTFGERAAMNMPLQGSASDIIKLAMVKIFDKFNELNLKSKVILQVHDELVVDVYPGELDMVKDILKNEMENVVSLQVKLLVNIECGKTWYDAK